MRRKALIAAALVLAAACASASGSGEENPIDGYGIRVIVLRSGPFDVRVTGGDERELSVDSSPSGGLLWDDGPGARVVHRREGSRLDVWVENDGLFPPGQPGQIRIRSPRDTDLIIQTSSGAVTVDGAGEGNRSIRTASGRIRIRGAAGRLTVDSVSGSIDIDSFEGDVNARSVSGRISGRALSLQDGSSFSSVSGNIEILLDPPLESFSFDLGSVSGRITVGSIRAERGLRMGFGPARIKGRTVSGALSFR